MEMTVELLQLRVIECIVKNTWTTAYWVFFVGGGE
jgi:hypothetical protein